MQNAIEVRSLCKQYTGFQLDHVSFTLPSGCIMGFIGPNGAGKSTTIRLMLGLARPDGGDIRLLGEDPATAGPGLRERLGIVMDQTGFPEALCPYELRRIFAACYASWDDARFSELSARFGLPERKPVKDFSRGMKMKLAIAAALAHDSRLLILDEATSGLDPLVREELLDLLREYIQDEGHSVFLSSHILSDLEKVCDYITFLNAGRLVLSEEKDALLEKYMVVKAPLATLQALDPARVIGIRHGSFGAEALVERGAARGLVCDPASMEDIMLYFAKENTK